MVGILVGAGVMVERKEGSFVRSVSGKRQSTSFPRDRKKIAKPIVALIVARGALARPMTAIVEASSIIF